MPRQKTEEQLREEQQLMALKEEVARQIVTDLSAKSYSQADLCEKTGYSNSGISMYKNHPSTMSGEFIRTMALALPEAFGWAWRRYESIVAPVGLAAPATATDETRSSMDRVIESARDLVGKLEDLRKKLP